MLLNPPSRIAVPGLATRAVPEVLAGFEAAGGAAVAHQGLGGLVEGALHQLVGLFVFKAFPGYPAGGRQQRWLSLQVFEVPVPR